MPSLLRPVAWEKKLGGETDETFWHQVIPDMTTTKINDILNKPASTSLWMTVNKYFKVFILFHIKTYLLSRYKTFKEQNKSVLRLHYVLCVIIKWILLLIWFTALLIKIRRTKEALMNLYNNNYTHNCLTCITMTIRITV